MRLLLYYVGIGFGSSPTLLLSLPPMTPQDIAQSLASRFGEACSQPADQVWQIDQPETRLLAILSDDQGWLRLLVPIVPAAEARPLINQILAANFEQTQMARYALHDDVLWGVYQQESAPLTAEQLNRAIDQLLSMKKEGVEPFFNSILETQLRQIIIAAKLQGQSMETTLQTIDRFYAEGMMGDMKNGSYGEKALDAWRAQLARLWPEVELPKGASNA